MKITYGSDIHKEFDKNSNFIPDIDNLKKQKPDVIILAGDIAVKANNVCDFAKMIHQETSAHVLLVAGNHEYYGSVIQQYNKDLETLLKDELSIDFLNNKKLTVEGVDFIGTTLWTSLTYGAYGNIEYYRYQIEKGMNDFRQIKVVRKDGSIKKFTTIKWLEYFKENLEFLREHLEKPKKNKQVVITHHAPIPCMDQYGGTLVGAYVNEFEHYFEDDKWKPDYWINGHTHQRLEHKIKDTVFLSNCRGYADYEQSADYFEWKYIVI